MSTPRIVVVGSINMDLTTSVSRFPAPGETLLGTAFATAAGGKGSNQAIAAAKADIQADLDKAIAKADAEIAAKSAESEKAISEIRASAMENVEAVAKDTAEAIVAAVGGSADAKTISAAVDARMKG